MSAVLNARTDGYRVLAQADIIPHLNTMPEIAAILGGAPSQWTIRDVADGYMNAVFLVDGPKGGICAKQALPWVRYHGESWPLSEDRAFFEASYMRRLDPIVGPLAPKLLHFDPSLQFLVIEKLTPHIVLRGELIEGRRYPKASEDVGRYVALAAFHTSDLGVPFERKFEDIGLFAGNHSLLRISVDLIFLDPYLETWRNRFVPELGAWAKAFREDVELKTAVARHRNAFLSNRQALLHGDLHSGSVMVTEDDTRVIDGEFSTFGPIGFDLGAYAANLILNWYAQGGYDRPVEERDSHRQWLLEQVAVLWDTFRREFLALWEQNPDAGGDGYPAAHFSGPAGAARLATLRRDYVDAIFADFVAFAAIKMIRRVLSYAQIADFGVIEDTKLRAEMQANALAFAREVLTNPARFADLGAFLDAVPRFEGAGLDPLARS
ncbi:methylthioribose kinase [Kaistia sp. 32K]|uniref:S-methyl-5-thioribose kinase n=1 Tax=Kaistia sp. 32K TaxID=2795690 RepID=UPI001916A300|nr:S-methyl-5-thioribose kinase [Kaistia sp. 32K]BCP55504.1 methylthioribose kinase [Kaistia sp. 32K]